MKEMIRNGGALALVLVVVVAMTSMTGCLGSNNQGPPPSGNTVDISNFAFVPANMTVSVGTTVTWVNQDSVTHTVTSDLNSPVPFDSGNLAPGAQYSRTFTTAGVYHYHCTIHPYMVAVIIVS